MKSTVVLVHGAFAESASWGGVVGALQEAGQPVVAVMTNVDADAGEIAGLVYVNAFAPAPRENCFGLAGRFAGSMVGEATVRPVPRSDGTTDL